jgi:hypothetical protein
MISTVPSGILDQPRRITVLPYAPLYVHGIGNGQDRIPESVAYKPIISLKRQAVVPI